MKIDTQFSIFLINEPGVLARVSSALADAKVNIVAMALMDSGEHGTLRIVCDDTAKTRQVLGKAHDRWTESDVVLVELDNKPGSFAAISRKLATEHVNITYAYCTGGAYGGKTTATFKLADPAKAMKVLAYLDKKPKRKSTPRRVAKATRSKK